MRLALVLFLALLSAPAYACDPGEDCDPAPEPPTVEEPEKPEEPEEPEVPPQPPQPPQTPQTPDEDGPREPREVRSTPKPAPVSCPKVKCVTDANGHRRAMFTADVQPDMYYLGRNFCATAPKDVEVTACCLAKPDHTYQIQYNVKVSSKAHSKAKEFCICVLGLD